MEKKIKPPHQNCHSDNLAPHPDHTKEIHRLNRIKGQLEGVARMITERRYCPEIITQVEAIRAALSSFQTVVLERHLGECVQGAFKTNNNQEREQKISELVELFKRR